MVSCKQNQVIVQAERFSFVGEKTPQFIALINQDKAS